MKAFWKWQYSHPYIWGHRHRSVDFCLLKSVLRLDPQTPLNAPCIIETSRLLGGVSERAFVSGHKESKWYTTEGKGKVTL